MIRRLNEFWLLLGITASGTTAWGADFFPLREGNNWTYRNAANGQVFTVTVGTPFVLNDRVYYSMRGYTAQPVLVRLDEQNELLVVDQETYREQKLISFQPSDTSWEAPFRMCSQQGQTAEQRAIHEGPAGPIRDVLDVRYQSFACADVGTAAEQFAENIGMLRRVSTSFAGPQVFDLVEAKVNKLQITARPHGRFTISTANAELLSDVTVYQELRSDGEPLLNLNFPSAQEFDVVVRDEAGTPIWTWSDGQFFAAGEHSRSIPSLWSRSVKIPRWVFSSPGLGNYTIEGWLTTAHRDQFAAMVPVTIAGYEEPPQNANRRSAGGMQRRAGRLEP
jgi:hypothetical protein